MKPIFDHKISALFLSFIVGALLVACGGGGGGSSSSGNNNGTGGSSITPPSITTRTGPNVVPVSIDGNVFSIPNEPFVNVTICSTTVPSSCMTIDHILVDTGSVGLRIFAQPNSPNAALSTLGLSGQTTISGDQVGECLQFVQGVTWGPVMHANLTVGQETAGNIAFQVINEASDTSFASAPAACINTGTQMDTPSKFGANGVLGIGLYRQDCGDACAQAPSGIYFGCTPNSNVCTDIMMPRVSQVQNPVSTFSTDNNGIILSFNTVPAQGAISASGTLTFGIGTQKNNTKPGNLNVISVDPYGDFKTVLEGQTYTGSYIDSGSNGLFFNAPTSNPIVQCPGSSGFYCPASELTLSAQIFNQQTGTTSAAVTFKIGNANATNNGYYVFDNLAGTATDISGSVKTFDWGLPFFFGRDVYVGIEDTAGGGAYFGF